MAWYQPVDVPSNNISLSVIYDGEVSTLTGQQHSYYLTWEDTIGTKKGYSQQNRPYELHVVVRDRDTIVGRYTGRSYPSTTCYFVTNAKQVEVFSGWISTFGTNRRGPGRERSTGLRKDLL